MKTAAAHNAPQLGHYEFKPKTNEAIIISGEDTDFILSELFKACNCTVAEVAMGGVNQLTCRTVGDIFHAEDGFTHAELSLQQKPTPATP